MPETPFDLAPEPLADPLDLSAMTEARTPPFVSPGSQAPKPPDDKKRLMKLAIMLPLAMKAGPGAVDGVLKAFAQSQVTDEQRARQAQIDSRAQDQQDWTRTYQQRQLDHQSKTQQRQLLDDFATKVQGLDDPAAINALTQLYTAQASRLGIRPEDLTAYAKPYLEPSRVQQRAAAKKIAQLKSEHGADKWMEIGAQFTHRLPGVEQPVSFDQLLGMAGMQRDPNAPKAQQPSAILPDVPLDRQHAMAVAAGNETLAKQIETAMSRQDATRRDPPRQPIQVMVGNSGLTRDQVSAAAGLRDDFRTESKDFSAARDGYERMLAAGTDPSPAGDVALLYGFMKLLDPNSVVRETEFATAARTGSLPQQIQAAAERVVNGQRLTKEQRADFMNRARGLFSKAQNRQNARKANYQRLAERSGVPAELVVMDDAPVEESPAQPAAAPAAGPKTQRIGRFEVTVAP